MSYEDIECKACGAVGINSIETLPTRGHPNIETECLVCECGHIICDIGEIDDVVYEVKT